MLKEDELWKRLNGLKPDVQSLFDEHECAIPAGQKGTIPQLLAVLVPKLRTNGLLRYTDETQIKN